MGGGGGGLFDFRVTPNPNLVWMDFHLDVEFDNNLRQKKLELFIEAIMINNSFETLLSAELATLPQNVSIF